MKLGFLVSETQQVQKETKLHLILTGLHGSVDEQTIGFQGRHADKQKSKCKREGDDFVAG